MGTAKTYIGLTGTNTMTRLMLEAVHPMISPMLLPHK